MSRSWAFMYLTYLRPAMQGRPGQISAELAQARFRIPRQTRWWSLLARILTRAWCLWAPTPEYSAVQPTAPIGRKWVPFPAPALADFFQTRRWSLSAYSAVADKPNCGRLLMGVASGKSPFRWFLISRHRSPTRHSRFTQGRAPRFPGRSARLSVTTVQ